MCGRYSWFSGAEVWNDRLGLQPGAFPRVKPRYNAAPSQDLPVVLSESPKQVSIARWGFEPAWTVGKGTKALINARAETVAEKPTFRKSFEGRRCLVLADSFFEWRRHGREKVPYRILLEGGKPFAMAGIWRRGKDGTPGFAIITTEANEVVAQIHHRMPVILPEGQEKFWIDDGMSTVRRLRGMLEPYDGEMEAYPVATIVNTPANDTPAVLDRAA
jgi:putative SOS response-associated peptidase YedK